MAFEVAEADRLLSRSAFGRSEKGLLALAAVALALGVAAWITDAGQGPLASAALPAAQDGAQDPVQVQVQDQVSFRDRFLGAPMRAGEAVGSTLQALDRAAINNLEGKLWDAKALLARQLMYSNWRTAAVENIRPSLSVDDARATASADDLRPATATATGIPLPRPRPTLAHREQIETEIGVADGLGALRLRHRLGRPWPARILKICKCRNPWLRPRPRQRRTTGP